MKLTLVRLFLLLVGLTIVLGFSLGWWSKRPTTSNEHIDTSEQGMSRVAPDNETLRASRTLSQAVRPDEDAQPSRVVLPAEHPAQSLNTSQFDGGPSSNPLSSMTSAADDERPAQVCANSSDCPPGQGCVFEALHGRMLCRASECDSDQHCPVGKICRVANDVGAGLPTRRCTQPGTQKEGDACHNLSSDISQTCQAGLLCVKGRCGRSCEKNTIGGCPSGSICVSTPEGSGCLASCRDGQCPLGQECIHFGDTASCATPIGRNCLKHGCGQGMGCDVTRRMDNVIFECRQHCSPLDSDSCPQGHVCGAGSDGQSVCYQSCDFAEHPCPQGYECYTVTEDFQTLGCRRMGQ